MEQQPATRWLDRVWLVQSVYYVVGGIWPLVHIRSFEAVTGPKTDRWLVKTVGILVSVIGTVLALAGFRRRITPEVAVLAVGAGAGLTGIDVITVARGRISRVYLLDALAHLFIFTGWVIALRRGITRNCS